MTIAAFDTASDILAIGLSKENNNRHYYLEINGGQKHSELIMDALDSLLRMAGILKTELDAVACMGGPGSFTGLRIGFAAVKGIALALGIPIIPIPTLDCMAKPFSFWPGTVIPVIDAKKHSVFTAFYRQGKRISNYLDIEIDELQTAVKNVCFCPEQASSDPRLLVTGPAVRLVLPHLYSAFPGTVSDCTCDRGYAVELLNLAAESVILNNSLDNFTTGPLYLRKSDAELNENMEKRNG